MNVTTLYSVEIICPQLSDLTIFFLHDGLYFALLKSNNVSVYVTIMCSIVCILQGGFEGSAALAEEHWESSGGIHHQDSEEMGQGQQGFSVMLSFLT